MQTDLSLPNNIEAERALLGAMMLNPVAIDAAICALGESGNSFHQPEHGVIYVAMVNLYRDGDPVDLVTLSAALSPKDYDQIGAVYIAELTDAVPTSANADYYAELVSEAWTRRELLKVCLRATGDLRETSVSLADIRFTLESAIFQIGTKSDKSTPERIGPLVQKERARLRGLSASDSVVGGIRTGFQCIDSILLPFRAGDYVILAARTSVGKTTMACNIALNASSQGYGVLILSMEMTKDAIASKLLAIHSGVDLVSVERNAYLTEYQKPKIDASVDVMTKLNIVIDDESGMTPTQMRTKVRGIMAQHEIGMVVIDYLGLMHVPAAESETVAVSTISREIKAMAKEMQIPVMALCQLNRAGNDRPQLVHLRQSGSLENDCDVAILLSRQKNENYVEAIIAKQRTGPIGEGILFFKKSEQRFFDTDEDGRIIEQKRYIPEDDDPIEDTYDEDDHETF